MARPSSPRTRRAGGGVGRRAGCGVRSLRTGTIAAASAPAGGRDARSCSRRSAAELRRQQRHLGRLGRGRPPHVRLGLLAPAVGDVRRARDQRQRLLGRAGRLRQPRRSSRSARSPAARTGPRSTPPGPSSIRPRPCRLTVPVRPGDAFRATVTFVSGHTYRLTLTNVTRSTGPDGHRFVQAGYERLGRGGGGSADRRPHRPGAGAEPLQRGPLHRRLGRQRTVESIGPAAAAGHGFGQTGDGPAVRRGFCRVVRRELARGDRLSQPVPDDAPSRLSAIGADVLPAV